MRWKQLPANLSNGQFKRLTGVKCETFSKMCFTVEAVKDHRRKHPNRGKQSTLRIEDPVLMMLMYNGEYRNNF